MNFYYIKLESQINTEILIEKLNEMKFKHTYLNDMSFCPYLIIHKDYEDKETPVYENINEGFLNKIKTNNKIEEITNIDDFISAARSLQIDDDEPYALF